MISDACFPTLPARHSPSQGPRTDREVQQVLQREVSQDAVWYVVAAAHSRSSWLCPGVKGDCLASGSCCCPTRLLEKTVQRSRSIRIHEPV